jgi:integrase
MLTDQALRAAVVKAKTEKRTIALRDASKTKGLEFRASYAGTASFAYVYKQDGKPKRLWLGNYSSAFGLSEARRAAVTAHGKRASGIDPVHERDAREAKQRASEAERKAAEEVQRRRVTFAKLAETFLGGDGRRHRSYSQVYDLNLKKPLGKLFAVDIKRSDLQRVIDAVVSRGANVQARRVYEVARAMLRWGVTRDYLTGEPWRGVELPDKGEARTRVLTAAEIRWLWSAADNASNQNSTCIIRLGLLLGQRSGEVAGMEQDEVAPDLMTWTIKAERTKNGCEHAVPLPPLARKIISAALKASSSEAHVFVGARGKPGRSDDISHEVADLINSHNETAGDGKQIERFTPHDLRRTVATSLEKMGVPLNIISATLNHISAKAASVTSQHYTHADLSMEVRGALTRWQATLEAILAGADPFETRVEDIEELERRMLAKGFGGPARLRVVS